MPICLPSFAGVVQPAGGFSNQYSVSFDGTNDYMDLTSAASLLNSKSIVTISFWYYAEGFGIPVGARGPGSTNQISFFSYDANNFYFVCRNGSGGNVVSATNPSLNQWVHCVGVKNGTSGTLYLTPNSTGVTDKQTATVTATLSATVGNYFNVAKDSALNQYFDGKVDELAVWNSALSDADVATLYNGGSPNDISSFNPVGWWRMGDNDGGTGTTITNQGSVSSIDGTLTNGPTFSSNVPS